jgi:hypothetical protein
MYLAPGDPGYNELAFTNQVIGFINEDGEEVHLNI